MTGPKPYMMHESPNFRDKRGLRYMSIHQLLRTQDGATMKLYAAMTARDGHYKRGNIACAESSEAAMSYHRETLRKVNEFLLAKEGHEPGIEENHRRLGMEA